MAAPKDTIYIDIDDEITTIIDKVRGSKEKIVALVLPKRSTTLQSIVNMKLLRRTSDEAKKHIVLITSDANLLPLAGAVGFYVAKTLQTRPVVPPAPSVNDNPVTITEDTEPLAVDDETPDPSKPIGVLAGMEDSTDDETIEVDNEEDSAAPVTAAAGTKKSFNKKLKVPNFERFRVILVLAALGLIGLGVFAYFAISVWPKAKVTIKTDTSSINANFTFTVVPNAKTVDTEKLIAPAVQKEVVKNEKQQVRATGQRDDGSKASGTVKLANCSDTAVTVPAGTGISSGNFTFITQTPAALDSGNFDSAKTCKSSGSHVATVAVVAQNNGDQYNLSARSYTVSGFAGVTAAGSNMTGGVSKIVKIISQGDIDGAVQRMQDSASAAATNELKQKFQSENSLPLPETFAAGAPKINASPAAGEPAEESAVSVAITYTMTGVKKDDLGKLIESDVKKRIDTAKQKISNNGADQATLKVADKTNPASIKTELQATATTGAEQNAETIKKLIAGKKSGDAQTLIKSRPGIEKVEVDLSPFWVVKVPKNPAKVTVIFQSANDSK
jgi:hypothetical protein